MDTATQDSPETIEVPVPIQTTIPSWTAITRPIRDMDMDSRSTDISWKTDRTMSMSLWRFPPVLVHMELRNSHSHCNPATVSKLNRPTK